MQALLRDVGPETMDISDIAKFQSAFEDGKLLPAEQ